MTDENKALIGRQCFVEFEGERQIAEIVDVVETVKSTNEIILYCLKLRKRSSPTHHYDIGTREVELI